MNYRVITREFGGIDPPIGDTVVAEIALMQYPSIDFYYYIFQNGIIHFSNKNLDITYIYIHKSNKFFSADYKTIRMGMGFKFPRVSSLYDIQEHIVVLESGLDIVRYL